MNKKCHHLLNTMTEYNGCFVEDEIEASNVFKQAASNLSTVNTLDESLNRFGYNTDDRIERRELVLMYSSIREEMEKEIHGLAHDSAYDSAKEMRGRLNGLKSDFGGLQTDGAKVIRDDQSQLFDKGATLLLSETRSRHTREMEDVLARGEELRRDLQKTHAIQQENLEKTLMRMVLPHTKYSKRLIELFKAESGYAFEARMTCHISCTDVCVFVCCLSHTDSSSYASMRKPERFDI